MGKKVGVLVAQGLDVPNFVNGVPMVPKSGMGNNLQSFLEGLQRKKLTMGREIDVSLGQEFDVSNVFKNVPKVPKFISE